MRLLFDHNVPGPLRQWLPRHDVELAKDRGWGQLTNGELLTVAEAAGFEVLVTADKNLRYQQNLAGRAIALLVLPTQHLETLHTGIDRLEAAIASLGRGGYQELDLPRPPLVRRPAPER